jgi:hypothetical protein
MTTPGQNRKSYDQANADFDSPLMQRLRKEGYGEDGYLSRSGVR